jgi:tetratricopeptide (TPR) repeat protein
LYHVTPLPDGDLHRLANVLSFCFGDGRLLWAGAFVGLLACCSDVWAWLSWRRHVVQPLREITEQISREPDDPELYWARGWIYLYETGLAERATAEFSRAIELEPNAWDLYDDRADAYIAADNAEQAVLDRTRAIAIVAESGELAPEHWWLYACRASDHRLAGDNERAIDDLTEAIRLVIADAEATTRAKAVLHYRRAMAHRRSGNTASARQDFRDAHRYDPLWRLDPRWWCMDIVKVAWLFVCGLGLGALYIWLSI